MDGISYRIAVQATHSAHFFHHLAVASKGALQARQAMSPTSKAIELHNCALMEKSLRGSSR